MAEANVMKSYGKIKSKSRIKLQEKVKKNDDIADVKEYIEQKIDLDIGYFRVKEKLDG